MMTFMAHAHKVIFWFQEKYTNQNTCKSIKFCNNKLSGIYQITFP